MAQIAPSFDDSAGYELFMGRWSRAAGLVFLDWLEPPTGAQWLEVGCGTGIFTQLILDACSPSSVSAVDSAPAQIDHAKRQPVGHRADFQLADAQALRFDDATFDVVASALTLNFIPDRPRALSEMRRVLRAGGLMAAYVWDFAAELSPSWPVRQALREIGADVPPAAGQADSSIAALERLLDRAGFESIAARTIDVTVPFADFQAFWQSQMPSYSAITKLVNAMSDRGREQLAEAVRARLPIGVDGTIEYSARANAVRARVAD